MKRIIFVGMHNKPDTPPLSIFTKSGRLVTEVIDYVLYKCEVPCSFKRTNLYDVDYYPKRSNEKYELAQDWHFRILPDHETDLIILLGAEVHKNFQVNELRFSNYPHPSSMWSKAKQKDYIFRMSREIITFLTD